MYQSPYDDGILGPRQKALIDQLQGGTAGAQAPPMQAPESGLSDVLGKMQTPQTPQAAPALDFSRLTGYDQGKFDANKQDAKYQIGRTLASFDPRQGITPDVLKALNGLGYGNFSGQGDKLSLSGLTDLGRQMKLSGDYSNADFVQGFKSGNGKWGYADPVAEAQQAQAAPRAGGGGLFGGSTISPMLHGDAQGSIQQALQNIGGLNDNSRLQQLIAALGGQ